MSLFGNLGNISGLMQQAKEMQSKFQDLQADLSKSTVIGNSGAGLVMIEMNGKGEALQVTIDDSLLNEEKHILQGLIASAINDAANKRQTMKAEKTKQIMGGFNMPEGFNFPFQD